MIYLLQRCNSVQVLSISTPVLFLLRHQFLYQPICWKRMSTKVIITCALYILFLLTDMSIDSCSYIKLGKSKRIPLDPRIPGTTER